MLESKRKAECREREVLFRDCVLNAIKKRKQCIYDDLNEIYNLSPKDFEDMVANLYRHLGFNVTQTPYINDGGKDAILSKDGIRYFLECKRYSPDAQIGRPMLQKLFAAMNEGHVEHGIFITTADFSKTAYEYGTRYGIQTINGQALVELIRDNVSLSDVQHEYLIPCLQCGEMISFLLFDGDENKKCCNGHNVNNIFYKNGNNSIICLRCGKKWNCDLEEEVSFTDVQIIPNATLRFLRKTTELQRENKRKSELWRLVTHVFIIIFRNRAYTPICM
ncbi:MAG: restriction endonuclease [Candidatus Ventricola sp.]|nr:restriction endonuclease [Candidatus Ventricola sp.]